MCTEEMVAERSSRRETILFVVLFIVLFGGLYWAFSYSGFVRKWFVEPWTATIASLTDVILRGLGERVSQTGNVIIGRPFSMNIMDGCNGITPLALLLAGVLSFPTTWRARAIGLALGIPALIVVNQLRILILYYVGSSFPGWFDRTHLYVAQAFVILLTAGFWFWWLGRWAAPVPTEADS